MTFFKKYMKNCFLLMIFFGIIQPLIINADNKKVILTQKNILWTDMTFKSSNVLVNMTIKINLGLPTETSGDLSQTMGLEPCSKWVNKDIERMTIETTVQKMFFFNEKYVEQIWFNAVNSTAYMRIRYRPGRNPWIKTYCWKQFGVYRLKIKPKNCSEKKKPPFKWSRRSRSFYPYPKDINSLAPVSDPSYIFCLLSALEPDQRETSFDIYVFGKKQLHRLTVRHEKSLPIKVVYKIHSPSSEVSINSNIKSCIFSIGTEPLSTEKTKPELFSLFGLEKDIRIYMDYSRRMPVRISGINIKKGKFVFDLSDVKFK